MMFLIWICRMICSIFAIASNGIIGNNDELPWPRIKEDMSFFRNITKNKTIIMGNNTFKSLNYTPLPYRKNVIVSTKSKYDNITTISENINEHILELNKENDVFIIGGAKLYNSTIDIIEKTYVTMINHPFDGDTYLDLNFLLKDMCLIKKEDIISETGLELSFCEYFKKEKCI